MARTGRPKKSEGDAGTIHIRINEDLMEMVRWILRIEVKETQATLIDPMIRPAITAKYKKYQAAIEKMKAAEAELRRVEAEAQEQVESPTPPRKRG